LVVEARAGLVLIDTGFARAVLERPSRMGVLKPFLGLRSRVEDAAVEQIKRLGFNVDDIRHIIPTHLDSDHAGAICDFPKARIQASIDELEAALHPKGFVERIRYREFKEYDPKRWQTHKFNSGEDWFGFSGVRAFPNSEDEILLIPLQGHTRGHFGVAVKTSDKWLLHAGDAYYNHAELDSPKPVGLGIFQRIVHGNYRQAIYNQARLADLKASHSNQIEIFCAHDPRELPL
jgi:glyoxylase-like metal-dependent hydrolase (beta-lactamase superfamily II)